MSAAGSKTQIPLREIASLARLDLSDDEVEALGQQLGSILLYFEQLDQVDTEGVEIASFSGEATRYRTEGQRLSMTARERVANAPDVCLGAFRVPKVI